MLFLVGIHNLTTNLTISQLDAIQMIPAPRTMTTLFDNQTRVKIQLLFCDIIFDSISSLTLEDMTITGGTKYNVVIKNTPEVSKELSIDGMDLIQSSLVYTYNVTATQITITIKNSILEQSSDSGLHITDKRMQGVLSLNVINSSISHHQQGGMTIESSSALNVTIRDCTIEANDIISDESGHSAAVSIHSQVPPYRSVVNISRTHFAHNRDLRGQLVETVVYVLGAHEVWITDCDFRHNRGTALRTDLIDSSLHLKGNVTYSNNTGWQGGALVLVSTQVYVWPGAHISFENNYAKDVGGAIYVESTSTMYYEAANDPDTRIGCFYKFSEMDNFPAITFINNLAQNGGHHIYGPSLISYCVVYEKEPTLLRSNDQQVRSCFYIMGAEDSPVSSLPSRVCVLDSKAPSRSFSDNCADVSQIFMTRSIFPGEEFNLEAILTGTEFGTGTGEVYAQFLPINGLKPNLQSPYQYSQRVNQLNFSKILTYAVFSNNSHEVLVLAATAGTVLDYGDKIQINKSIQTYIPVE